MDSTHGRRFPRILVAFASCDLVEIGLPPTGQRRVGGVGPWALPTATVGVALWAEMRKGHAAPTELRTGSVRILVPFVSWHLGKLRLKQRCEFRHLQRDLQGLEA